MSKNEKRTMTDWQLDMYATINNPRLDEPYRQQLRENIDILLKLDGSRYPTLNDELRKYKGAFCRRLVQFLEQIEKHPKAPYHDRDGKAWHFVTFKWLSMINGGSEQTWHDCIVFGAALGLIERLKPRKHGKYTTAIARSAGKAKAKGQRAVSWYHIPYYSDAVLIHAEKTAIQFRREGINRSSLSTGGLIQAVGKAAANKAIVYSRGPSRQERQAEQEIVKHLRQTIKTIGYTTKDATICAAINAWYAWAEGARPPLHLWRLTVNRVWQNRNKRILKTVQATYGRPSKDEKERWNLTGNGWIIRSPP